MRDVFRSGLPVTLAGSAVVVLVQGAVAVALAVFVAVEVLVVGPADPGSASFLAVFGGVVGIGLVLVGRGLLRRRRWGRTPALLTQPICVPIGIALAQGDRYAIGIPLCVVAVLTGAALLAPPTTRALYPGPPTG